MVGIAPFLISLGSSLTTVPKFGAQTDAVIEMPMSLLPAACSVAGDEGKALSKAPFGGAVLRSQFHYLPCWWSRRGCREVCGFMASNDGS